MKVDVLIVEVDEMTTVHIVVGASSCVSYPIDILHARTFGKDTLSSPNFLYQYFLISLLVFQVLEVAYSDRDAA